MTHLYVHSVRSRDVKIKGTTIGVGMEEREKFDERVELTGDNWK